MYAASVNAGVSIFRGKSVVPRHICFDLDGKTACKTYSRRHWFLPQRRHSGQGNLAITSNEVFVEKPPGRALSSAAYIVVEFASIFNGLGVQTHARLPRRAAAARLRRDLGTRAGEEWAGKGSPVFRIQSCQSWRGKANADSS